MSYFDFLNQEAPPLSTPVAGKKKPILEELPESWNSMRPDQQALWKRLGEQQYTPGKLGESGTFTPKSSLPPLTPPTQEEQARAFSPDFKPGVATTDRTSLFGGTGMPANPNSPEEILKKYGVPHEDFHKAVLDIAGQLGLDPDEHINFGLGLDRVLKLPGMEDVHQEWSNEAQRLSTSLQQGVGKSPASAPPPSLEDVERQNLKLDLKALANEEPLNNTGSVIAMVLLSMVIGPHLAILFFRRSAKANELAQQVADRRVKLKEYQKTRLEDEERAKNEAMFMRKLAAESSERGKEKRIEEDISLRHQIMLKELGAFIHATEAAKKAGNDEQKAMVKGLKNQWSSYTAQGNSYLRQVKDIQDEMYYNQGALDPQKKMKMLADEEQYRKLAGIEFEKAGKIHQEAEKMFLKYGLTAGPEEFSQDAEK